MLYDFDDNNENDDDDITEHGGLTPADTLTEACSLGLQRASCMVSYCIIITGFTTDTYILLDVLLCSIAAYFYEMCRILVSP